MRHSILITALGYALLVSLASRISVSGGAGTSGYEMITPPLTPGDDVQYSESPLGAARPSTSSCIADPQAQMLSDNDIYPSRMALIDYQWGNSIEVQQGIDAMNKLVETLPSAWFTIPESLPDVKMVGALKQIQPDIQLQQAVINVLGEKAPALILAGLWQYIKELPERLGLTQNKQLLHTGSPNTAWLLAKPSETLGLE
ncbi:hypothetical protein H4R35_005587 [Dimargaris xerosporica]|nr:hypothetical protein H4R35_005587 [Dimargaris xerosporica]